MLKEQRWIGLEWTGLVPHYMSRELSEQGQEALSASRQ